MLANADVTKSGDVSDGDSCNFYDENSIVLAVGEGSNGLFATDGATIWANNWGTSSSNGVDVTLTAREQTLEGNVSVDTSSGGGSSEDESASETEVDDEDEGGFLSWLQGVWDWITSLFS